MVRWGDFEVDLSQPLGSGAMGTVYRATQVSLRRTVAVKVVSPGLSIDRAILGRFEQEALAMARVSHPNVVQIYGAGQDEHRPWFAMEFVEGESLSAHLERTGPLPPEEVARIGLQIARGIGAALERGIVHRDLKPSNVLRLPDGTIKVMDFGLAKLLSHDSQTTIQGTVLGTPLYMSPEQAMGKSVDGRSDIYSLGAILYELASAKPPFQADSVTSIVYLHVHETPELLHKVTSAVSQPFARIVARCLEKVPARRFQTPTELADALEGYLRNPKATGRRIRADQGIFALASVAALGLAIYAWKSAPPVADPPKEGPAPKVRVSSTPPVAPPVEPAVTPPEPTATPPEPAATPPEPTVTTPEPTATPPEPTVTTPEPTATPPEPAATTTEPTAPGPTEPAPPEPPAPVETPPVDPFEHAKAEGEAHLSAGRMAEAATSLRAALAVREDEATREKYLQAVEALAPEGMALVRGAVFMQGADEEAAPAHSVSVSPFYLDKTEVTTTQYGRFLAEMEASGDHSRCHPTEPAGKSHVPKFRDVPTLQHTAHPVVGVDWWDAYAYAAWAGKRLPTEAEWELAARGTEGRTYPWGDAWDGASLNSGTSADVFPAIAPVGSFPSGATPLGVQDLAGNVSEWCADWWAPYVALEQVPVDPSGPAIGTLRVVRGGSCAHKAETAFRGASRTQKEDPSSRITTLGFRCAKGID
ncbi:MAG: bifunctional serine/threonine-protein kinase/formylglycine-generating enzyme family protein [Planctomycetota bacterium]